MKRVLLLSTTTGYQADAFLRAARELDIEIALGTDRCHVLEDPWRDGALALRFENPENNAAVIEAQHRATPFDGIAAIGDAPAETAAVAADRIGLTFHTVQGARAARDKLLARRLLRDAGLRVPFFSEVDGDNFPPGLPFPCVLKPASMSASRGVIRANDGQDFHVAYRRILSMNARSVLVEGFIPGRELALEGIVDHGRLQVLAVFDKPDPLDGPFFEETIYVTPSRLDAASQEEITGTVARGCEALGLWHGPIHAEVRWNDHGAWILEIAARPIGGLCSRALRFRGESLESLILRHAIGENVAGFVRESNASAVMMIPVPRAGVFAGVDAADAGDVEIEITAKIGEALVPWPEGSSYLGFIFARANSPAEAEQAVRLAHQRLGFRIQADLPVLR